MLFTAREAGAMAMAVWMCSPVRGPQGWPQGKGEPWAAARLQMLKLARAGLGLGHAGIPPAEGGGRVVVPTEEAAEFLAEPDIVLFLCRC